MEEIKLDNTLQTRQERLALVQKIIDNAIKPLTERQLEILSDYIIAAMTKEEKKKREVLTENRLRTIEKRETSFQGLLMHFENGEDAIYNLIKEDKNAILSPKVSITEQDRKDIPELRELQESIQNVERQIQTASGRSKYLLYKQLIEMRKDQYVIKDAYRKPIYSTNLIKSLNNVNFDEKISIAEDGSVSSTGFVNFYDPEHISALLCNYSLLKENSWDKFRDDLYYVMMDLDNLIEKTLRDDHPFLYDLLIYKIDGRKNEEIQQLLFEKHGIHYTTEHLSKLWRNKIPKLLAKQASDDYVIWYYTTQEYGKWKKCSRCGQIKLAHIRFFSKNKTSRDGYYSICKECRSQKKGGI